MTQVKELLFEEDVRIKLREGVIKLADVASITLGPKGRPVGIQESRGIPSITTDGYTIVKDLEFKDQFVNMGAALAREAAAKMKEVCGDGTTSTLLLLRALVEGGLKNIGAGTNPITLKKEMEKSVNNILQELDFLTTPIASIEELLPIALSSASGNQEVGTLVAQAVHQVGRGGVVTIEEGKTAHSHLEKIEGMQLDWGYLSPYFCTHTETRIAKMHTPALLITDMKISSIQEVLPLMEAISVSGQELLIIADDIQQDALSTLVINKLRGTLKVCAIKAPSFGKMRKELLQDLAVLTGATFISEEVGLSLKEATLDMLGKAQQAVISKDTTTIIGGTGDAAALQERLKLIDAQILLEKNISEKTPLERRKAQLSGGMALIRVGGITEPEMKQKKQLFEDSLNATLAALEEGVVPGGGVALLRASSKNSDTSTGAQIVQKACQAPFRHIVQNSGFDSSLFLEQILSQPQNWGFNALTEQVEDLSQSGIVDPCKIVKHALQTALSSAILILLSEALIGHAP